MTSKAGGPDVGFLASTHEVTNQPNELVGYDLYGSDSALRDPNELELRARDIVDRMALAFEASLLVRRAPAFVADAFCRTGLDARGAHDDGTIPPDVDFTAIIARATPPLG